RIPRLPLGTLLRLASGAAHALEALGGPWSHHDLPELAWLDAADEGERRREHDERSPSHDEQTRRARQGLALPLLVLVHALGVVAQREVVEAGARGREARQHLARRPVALLGDDELGDALRVGGLG